MYCIKDKIKNINIVIGCNIGCSYCYARINNKRFKSTSDFNKPVYFENKLKMLDSNRSKAYFLTGQTDLSLWEDKWIKKIFNKMEENLDKAYIFLTKRPEKIKLDYLPKNAWVGVTVTKNSEIHRIEELRKNVNTKNLHVTFEPLFEEMGEIDFTDIKWIVIGTETGSRKNKAVTLKSWIYKLLENAKRYNCKVFFKEDLLGIINEDEFIQEMPEEFI